MSTSKIKSFKKHHYLTDAEIEYMMENRLLMPLSKMARHLDRPAQTLRSYFKRNELETFSLLNDDDKEYIHENYLTLRYSDIADDLGVSRHTVVNYCKRMNLKKENILAPYDENVETPYERPEGIVEGTWAAFIHQEIKRID